jgi:hypothetical protein
VHAHIGEAGAPDERRMQAADGLHVVGADVAAAPSAADWHRQEGNAVDNDHDTGADERRIGQPLAVPGRFPFVSLVGGPQLYDRALALHHEPLSS